MGGWHRTAHGSREDAVTEAVILHTCRKTGGERKTETERRGGGADY